MKASAALLAGLLAGLALGGGAHAAPTSLFPAPALVLAGQLDEDEEEDEAKNPFKNANRKSLQCAAKCQDPALSCHQRCKHSKTESDCLDGCGKRLLACIEKCGVRLDGLEE